jgi:predicted transcriptional regulator
MKYYILLKKHGQLSLDEIIELSGSKKSAVHGALRRLIDKGLVKRVYMGVYSLA